MAVLLFKTPLIVKTAYETDKIRYEPAKNGFSLEELYLFGEDFIFDHLSALIRRSTDFSVSKCFSPLMDNTERQDLL